MAPPTISPGRIYRTPDSRFSSLPSSFTQYEPHYGLWGNVRYAFLDVTGPVFDLKSGTQVPDEAVVDKGASVVTETVLCMSGEPSWSFLYRKMIPGFLHDVHSRPAVPDARRFIRRRVIAPDFIGFGRSDKPIDDDWYTWDNHRDWLIHFVRTHIADDDRTVSGGRVSLVVQDWGGLLGLLLPLLFSSLFSHLIVLNTALATGIYPSKAWIAFRDFVARSPDMNVGALLKRGTPLSKEEVAGYDAPFDGYDSKAGVRRFPQLVPVNPLMRGASDSVAAMSYYRSLQPQTFASNALSSPLFAQSQGQDSGATGEPLRVFFVVGASDPVLGVPVMRQLAESAFMGVGYFWHVIDQGGHFVQEWSAHVPSLVDKACSSPPPSAQAAAALAKAGGASSNGPILVDAFKQGEHLVQYRPPQPDKALDALLRAKPQTKL